MERVRHEDPSTIRIFAQRDIATVLYPPTCLSEGQNQASVIGAIISGDPPPVSALQTMSAPALDQAVTTCLSKDPDRRSRRVRGAWLGDRGLQNVLSSLVGTPDVCLDAQIKP